MKMQAVFSIQWRLAIGLVLGITLMWIVATLLSALNMASELSEVFDGALEQTAERILPLAVADIIDREQEGREVTISGLHEGEEVLSYVVRDGLGRVLLKSSGADPARFPRYEGAGFVTDGGYRYYFDSAMQESLTVAVSEPLSKRREAVLHSAASLLWPLPFLIPLSIIGVWFLVGRAVRPVNEFSVEIERRGGGDLTPLDVTRLPVEFKPVGQEVNRLLERLRRTLEAERSFAANSAHELRTPVAAALAQTQRLLAETTDRDTLARAGEIEAALRRLSALAEKLMQLAKSESGALNREQSADVRPVLELVIEDFRRDPQTAARLEVRIPDTEVLSDIDPNALAILARNLLENALKHGQAGASVAVRLSPGGEFSVANDGAPMDADALARIRRPFERGETMAGGTGLGLAIAAAIAQGSGCALELMSPARGRDGGFEAVLRLG